MRFAFAATSLYLCLGLLAPPPASSQALPAANPAPQANIDAAAKHATRTACLKEVKSKKLLGAEKTAFLKNCNAEPAGAMASTVSPP
jgi:hypothetical protein